jgi:glycosyltransferase involved in cell wall biosynthesis
VKSPLSIALIVSDEREVARSYQGEDVSFGQAPDALLSGFACLSDCKVHVVSCLQQPVRSPERLAPNIFIHSLAVPKVGWLRTGYAGCLLAIRRKLKSICPDIVHGQGTERYCALAAAFSGFPNVITIHGNMRTLARLSRARVLSFLWCHARLESLVLPRTGGVFCNSESTERRVRPRAKRTWRVSNPLNPVYFSPRSEQRSSPPLLLNIGTITPLKGQLELLDAAERWHAAGRSFELQFLGRADPGTDYGKRFRKRLEEPSVARFARHVGFEPAARLVQRLDAASALIHVSREESFGLVIAEALARNLKVFAFAAGGVSEVVADAELAELYPVNDWAALSTGLERWFGAGCPLPRTAADTMARHAPETIARSHLEIYRDLLT